MTDMRKTLKVGLTGNTLKLIAIFTMLIDHIGAAVIEAGILSSNDMARMMAILETERGMQWYLADIVLRLIGRLAFPIFCFLLVEGFTHTGNEAKYARNLLLFALISEIPFDLAFFGRLFFPGAQNVYFTLFLGVEMMCFLKKYAGRPVIQGAAVAAACGLSVLLKSDYSYGDFNDRVFLSLKEPENHSTYTGRNPCRRRVSDPVRGSRTGPDSHCPL